MEFGHYLKECRKNFGLTQEELVEALYTTDPELFGSLDASALSKWERGVSQTSYRKMGMILRYFQQQSGMPLPCIDDQDPQSAERGLCEQAMRYLLGTPPRHLVIDLHMDRLQAEHFSIIPLRQFERMDELLEIHQNLHENLTPPHDRLSIEQTREWALHPESLFYVILYKRTLLGFFFSLRIRPERFESIMEMTLRKNELRIDDLARPGEKASVLILSFFALDSRMASLLLLRLYAHLIAHQREIRELGLVSTLPEVDRVVERMALRISRTREIDGRRHRAYRNDLFRLFSNETAMRLLFPKEECPEPYPSPDNRSDDR